MTGLGMDCWAIGGPFWRSGTASGCGYVDDDSIQAIHHPTRVWALRS